MSFTGIVCEYNPFHRGHKKQLDLIRTYDPAGGIVCLMSGNFVQRGRPAILDKLQRAEAAVRAGADLVLELPVTAALSSAEGFAAEGVRILGGFCDRLCFGSESGDEASLTGVAQALLSPVFREHLKTQLELGLSFPAARQKALETMGLSSHLLRQPNDILAIEYCKAILAQGSTLKPMVIRRQGSYHDLLPDKENPSATAVRGQMLSGSDWQAYVPEEVRSCFERAVLHTMEAGERAVLTKLRTMTDTEFESLPYGSEGLWRKLMKVSREYASLEEILNEVKSKRYTRTRLDRMVMCAFLGLTVQDLSSPAPYVRVLALNDRGREILKKARRSGTFPNVGEPQEHPYQNMESRCGDLYGLFAENAPEAPGRESKYRIYYQK